MRDRVLLPLLGDLYAGVLEKGELKLAFEIAGGTFGVRYYQRRFPVSPATFSMILRVDEAELDRKLGADRDAWNEYQGILAGLDHLPDVRDADAAHVAERHRQIASLKHRLGALAGRSPVVREFVERNVEVFNGKPGEPSSFDRLDALLTNQNYRLTFWRNASDEIDYRRFFDVNDLAALAMEREDVFEASHQLILRLLAEGHVAGLRIDHPDGLYDPEQYLVRLQQHFLLACARRVFESDPRYHGQDWERLKSALLDRVADVGQLRRAAGGDWPLYVVAEKILAVGEPLPDAWPVHGTSGYDFLNMANGLFVDPAAEEPFTRLYHEYTGDDTPFAELVYRKKRLILDISLASELHMLAHQLDRLAQRDRRTRDFTLNGLRLALREVIACFPVYRPYISDEGVSETDVRRMEQATEEAIRRNPKTEPSVYHFIRDTILQRVGGEDLRADQRRFAGKFQQVTAPATAKGVEDTAFYIYHRLISLNEVGGEPAHFGVTPRQLHEYLRERQSQWPHAMSALSTHDTKRSEDVRARINVLSEMPAEWEQHVTRWRALNAPHRKERDGVPAPSPDEEYLLYQTLLGAYPIEAPQGDGAATFVKRIQAYMQKAMREAKLRTSWTTPNEPHESAVAEFVASVLDEQKAGEFLKDFRPFQRRISELGMLNSLAQTLLRLTAPGVPDTYQGTELWDLSLVDPDNRRPVDYDRRRQMLEVLKRRGEASAQLSRELLEQRESGAAKLYVTWRALTARRDHPGLFTAGEYIPLEFTGSAADHAFGFARRRGTDAAVVIVPRLVSEIAGPDAGAWGDTTLRLPLEIGSDRTLRNVFTGEAVPPVGGGVAVARILGSFPVALFV